MTVILLCVLTLAVFFSNACSSRSTGPTNVVTPPVSSPVSSPVLPLPLPAALDPAAKKIIDGLDVQIGEAASYTTGYYSLSYPGGDIPRTQGVCTDVVVRALRTAGYDLQKLIHEDMQLRFSEYPSRWKLTKPDPNIDHRRVPNQRCYFEQAAQSLPVGVVGDERASWRAGDIVYWKLDSGLDHCGVLHSRRGASGYPLVVHNLGVCQADDCLTSWEILGHYRFPKR